MGIQDKKAKTFKDAVRVVTFRNHGMNFREMVTHLNQLLRGLDNYYRAANFRGLFYDLMEWIRRKLKMKQMREWKTT